MPSNQPAATSAGADPRMAGLPADVIPKMHAAARAIRDGEAAVAQRLLDEVLATVPEHPEALRLTGILHNRCNRPADAKAVLQRALQQRPDDADILSDLGSALRDCGERDAAFASWRRACELAPDQPMPWYNLGRNLQMDGNTVPAADALRRACELAPDFLPSRILLGDALLHLGHFDDADDSYRAALRLHPACGDAWRGLANIKTRPLSDADREQLALQLRRTDIVDPDRIAMGYALGKVCEDQGLHAEAFAAVGAANARLRGIRAWNAEGFHRYVDAVIAATTCPLPDAADPQLGTEVIFIVGMPRSGSTLFEQILAAHPQVEGGSELPDLGLVLQAESMRRNQPFPQWVSSATCDDWQRLGREYLQRTARWRERRPRFTDKMPENWLFAGVLRAMMPGATVIDARRDPLETGWSCFRQHFYPLPHFSCDLADIGAYLRDCEQAMDLWRSSNPRIRVQHYEALLADPELRIRELLDFCGLSFDAACLDFHRSQRSVRTASAAQVRQPLRSDTARAHHYGTLLDPLRKALGRNVS